MAENTDLILSQVLSVGEHWPSSTKETPIQILTCFLVPALPLSNHGNPDYHSVSLNTISSINWKRRHLSCLPHTPDRHFTKVHVTDCDSAWRKSLWTLWEAWDIVLWGLPQTPCPWRQLPQFSRQNSSPSCAVSKHLSSSSDTHDIVLYPIMCVPLRGPQSPGVLHFSLLNPQDPELALQIVLAQEISGWTKVFSDRGFLWTSFLTVGRHRREERTRFRNPVKAGSGVPEGKYKDIMMGWEQSSAVLAILHSNCVLRALRHWCLHIFSFYLRNYVPGIFLTETTELEIRPYGHMDGSTAETVPINYSMAPHHCLLRLHLIHNILPTGAKRHKRDTLIVKQRNVKQLTQKFC